MEVQTENVSQEKDDSSPTVPNNIANDSMTFEKGSGERRKSLTVEEKYQKLDQREHVLKRPDMYSNYLLCCCNL